MQIQVYSDIHLELLNKFPEIKPLCDYLILAGDIGKINDLVLLKFLAYCSKNWLKVFYILGNHEFYIENSNFTEINELYKKKLTVFSNIYFLDNDYVPLNDNINVYGSTLWTLTNDDNDYKFVNRKIVNDISKIETDKLKLYLEETNKKTIIVTHFPPTQKHTTNPIYDKQDQSTKDYFSHRNILYEVKKENILCWISGHTHYSYDIIENDIRCISNQFGYIGESTNIKETGLFNLE